MPFIELLCFHVSSILLHSISSPVKILHFNPRSSFKISFGCPHPFAEARDYNRRPWRVTSPYLDPGTAGHHLVVVASTLRVFLCLSLYQRYSL